jgi:transposase-like protein
MHILDYNMDELSRLFRFNNYPAVEKAYSAILLVYALRTSLRDTMASRWSVRKWPHRFPKAFSMEKRFRDFVAVDEAMVNLHGLSAYVWSAEEIDFGETLAIYASWGRNMLIAMKFLRMVLGRCINKPLVDIGPWYRWAVERLGLYQNFGLSNAVERIFRIPKTENKKVLQQHKYVEYQVDSSDNQKPNHTNKDPRRPYCLSNRVDED